jgi:hypothetical protein
MAFKEDLITARSYIVFIAGLLTAFAMVYYIEKQSAVKTQIPPVAMIKTVIPSEQTPQATLSRQDSTPVPSMIDTPELLLTWQQLENKISPLNVAKEMMADVSTQKPIALAAIDTKTPSLSKHVKRSLTKEEQVWAKIGMAVFY